MNDAGPELDCADRASRERRWELARQAAKRFRERLIRAGVGRKKDSLCPTTRRVVRLQLRKAGLHVDGLTVAFAEFAKVAIAAREAAKENSDG